MEKPNIKKDIRSYFHDRPSYALYQVISMVIFLTLTIMYWSIMGKVSTVTFWLAFLIGMTDASGEIRDRPSPKICNFLLRFSIFSWLFVIGFSIIELVIYHITLPLSSKIKSKFNDISYKIDKANTKLDKRINKDK